MNRRQALLLALSPLSQFVAKDQGSIWAVNPKREFLLDLSQLDQFKVSRGRMTVSFSAEEIWKTLTEEPEKASGFVQIG